MKKWSLLLLVTISVLNGCATIVGDKTQAVQVNSDPSGVNFSIKDETGRLISHGVTPQNVTLQKSDGSYFGNRHSAPNLGINSTVSIAENINDGLVNRIEVRYLR